MRGALGDGPQEGRSGEGTGGRIRTLVHLLSWSSRPDSGPDRGRTQACSLIGTGGLPGSGEILLRVGPPADYGHCQGNEVIVGPGCRRRHRRHHATDRKADGSWAASVGVPLNRALGIRINYGNAYRWRFVGNQSRTLSLGLSASWR